MLFNEDWRAGYDEGSNDMLEKIRESLKEYPTLGGDIEIMTEVERLISEAWIRGYHAPRTAEIV